VSYSSVSTYLGGEMEGCSRLDLATLVQMEHFEGFESFEVSEPCTCALIPSCIPTSD
jgi:hypothetical protein